MGAIKAATPRMRRTLTMLLPTTFPTAMAEDPDSAACKLVTNSGVEVPKPTSVSPMTIGEMPNDLAAETAPRTSSSPPMIKPRRPKMTSSIAFISRRVFQLVAIGM